MRGKKRHKVFWHNLKFKYKLTILNENTLEEVGKLRVSKLNALVLLLVVLVLLSGVVAAVFSYTPVRDILPGYMNTKVRTQIVQNALKVDSLEMLVQRQNWYIMNIQDIFAGRVKADTVRAIDTLTSIRWEALVERSETEEAFRKEYEEKERYNLVSIISEHKIEGLEFFRPTRGMLTTGFDSNSKHYGIDIAAKPGESILSTLDGVVVMAGYTAEAGYVMIIHHTQDLLSIYKHCGSLLKKEGDRVKGGEAIALVGNTELHASGPHLHFELWQKGAALNPEKYIIF